MPDILAIMLVSRLTSEDHYFTVFLTCSTGTILSYRFVCLHVSEIEDRTTQATGQHKRFLSFIVCQFEKGKVIASCYYKIAFVLIVLLAKGFLLPF